MTYTADTESKMAKFQIPATTKIQCDCCGRFMQPHGTADNEDRATFMMQRWLADGAGHHNLSRIKQMDLCDRCVDIIDDAIAQVSQERHEFFAGESA